MGLLFWPVDGPRLLQFDFGPTWPLGPPLFHGASVLGACLAAARQWAARRQTKVTKQTEETALVQLVAHQAQKARPEPSHNWTQFATGIPDRLELD